MWPRRVDAIVYTCANAEVSKQTQETAEERPVR
jgi:hypothetical protein